VCVVLLYEVSYVVEPGVLSPVQQLVLVVSCMKDAETSAREFMETYPIMSEFDACLKYYMVNSVVIALLLQSVTNLSPLIKSLQ